MEKSIFAGLTILDPDESILEDNGAFTNRDRRTIDRFLEIGSKTHRHNAAAGLGNPVSRMGASAVASAGQIPADLAFSVGYTLEDDQGGETLLSPLVTLSTPAAIAAPSFAPDGVIDYTAGNLLTDTYYYAYSYVDGAGGETPAGPTTAVEREPGYANARSMISGLTVGVASAGAAGWRLYRAVGGGDLHYLASGTADSYIDNGSVSVNCDITPLPESINTTKGANSLIVRLPSADAIVASATSINLYISQDGTFSGNVLVDNFPIASAGASRLYTALSFLNGQPPDANTSIGGASKIDPDTELIDWHWKRPVATVGSLPFAGEEGDVRLVTDQGKFYFYTMVGSPSGWASAGIGGGGGGGLGNLAIYPHIVDDFASTLDPGWFFNIGSTADLNATGGHLTPQASATAVDLSRNDLPFLNGKTSLKVHTGTGVATSAVGIYQRGAGNYATAVAVLWNATANQHLTLYVAGSQVDDAGLIALAAGTNYWLELKVDGSQITYNIYGSDPTVGTPSPLLGGSVTADLSALVGGNAGILSLAQDTAWYYDDFTINLPLADKAGIEVRASAGLLATLDDVGDGYGRYTIKLDPATPLPSVLVGEAVRPGSTFNPHIDVASHAIRFASGNGVSVLVSEGDAPDEALVILGLSEYRLRKGTGTIPSGGAASAVGLSWWENNVVYPIDEDPSLLTIEATVQQGGVVGSAGLRVARIGTPTSLGVPVIVVNDSPVAASGIVHMRAIP